MLLRAVCESPDDDTPRLVFADWLQENNEDGRAEFIRLQVKMAQVKDRAQDDWLGWQRLCAREQELREAHDEEWWKELPDGPGYRLGRIFSRGFIETVFVSEWRPFVAHHERILASCPVVSLSVRCSVEFKWQPTMGVLARFQHLLFLGKPEVEEAGLLALIAAPLPRLRSLTLKEPSGDLAFLRRRLRARFGDKLRHGEWLDL